MPTKRTNISLSVDDLNDVKELRSWLENKDDDFRLSLVDTIRRAIMFAKHRKVDFIDALHSQS